MNKIYTFKDSYRILGQNPSCEWSELRKSYKKLIHLWHPDRFPENSTEKEVANEKIKAINIAYNQIHAYYRENNALPSIETTENAPQSGHPIRAKNDEAVSAGAKPGPERPKTNRPASKPEGRSKPSVESAWRPSYGIAIACFSLVAFYFIYTNSTEQHPHTPDDTQAHKSHYSSAPVTDSPVYADQDLDADEEKISDRKIDKKISDRSKHDAYFTYGDSIGKVITAQGVPDRTDGDVWYYGQSEVHHIDFYILYPAT